MANRVKFLFIIVLFAFSSCLENADLGNAFVADQSVSDRFNQSIEWNEKHGYTAIGSKTENYSIITFGDSHIGGTKNIEQTLSDADSLNTVAVVMNGDITTGHEKDFEVLEDLLLKYNHLNTFMIPGNHDLYFNGWEGFSERFGTSFYYFTVNTPSASDLFFCLDTGSGTLGSEQLNWFKNELEKKRSNYRKCIVFTHNNLFRFRQTFSTNPMVDEIRVLLELFEIYNVDMVVTAHDYIRNTQKFGNTQHIIMDALQDINKNASYLKIESNSNKLSFSFTSL
ncbi:MAG: metallophosphoesterase [Prolixibacteraceae bacterium]|jgi:3',5'-cyclic AMP phosphodiesterase CpdA|nr:metallophosphoesterase [Prolixibacteraceae bacterium]